MLNYELTKALVQDRQHEMTHNAVMARLARRVRRTRRQDAFANDTELFTPIELPAPIVIDAHHPLAA